MPRGFRIFWNNDMCTFPIALPRNSGHGTAMGSHGLSCEHTGTHINTLGRIGFTPHITMKEVDVYEVCIAELLAGQLLLNSDYHRKDIVNYKFSCISFEKLALTPRTRQLKAAQTHSAHPPPRCLLIIPPNHNLGPRCPL